MRFATKWIQTDAKTALMITGHRSMMMGIVSAWCSYRSQMLRGSVRTALLLDAPLVRMVIVKSVEHALIRHHPSVMDIVTVRRA